LIESLLQTKAALIIASHRVSILEPCDKVIVMKAGKIIASGRFNDVRPVIDTVKKETREGTHHE
jgi:ABC-type bacteriocin/lantibiotic exporter with double-glycine peptidase domain